MESTPHKLNPEGRPNHPYLPATIDPSLSLDQQNLEGSAERLVDLYNRMRPYRSRLDAILEYCQQPRTMTQIQERAQKTSHSVYDEAALCRLLVRAGGLAEQAGAAPEVEVVEVNGTAYLDPSPASQEPALFATTDAGSEHLANAQSLLPFLAFLNEEPRYRHVYRILLDLCANDGGATAQQLDDSVSNDPDLQEPRMYASYFYDRLDRAGLIDWTGSWTATEAGRNAIAYLAEHA